MKKSIAIFCLAALLLSTSSLSLFYWVQEQWHEQERFASIDVGDLTIQKEDKIINSDFSNDHQIKLILKDKSLLPEGYHWEEEGREFSYDGMFYDIVSLTKTASGWELIAASDKEEAEIVAKQSKAQKVDKEFAGNKKANKQKLSVIFSLYEGYEETMINQEATQFRQQLYANYQDRLTNAYLGQIFPPPKAV